MDIMKRAEIAINESLDHYFTMLTNNDTKTEELYFLTDLISQIQGWLLFSEASLNNISTKITESSLGLNLINNLSVLFYSRLQVKEPVLYDTECAILNRQLAKAFCVIDNSNSTDDEDVEDLSILPEIYSKRLVGVNEIISILTANKMLVIIALLYLYISPRILNYLK